MVQAQDADATVAFLEGKVNNVKFLGRSRD